MLAVRRIDRVSNILIVELCGFGKWVEERIGESILQWFSPIESMENNKIFKRVYVEECVGSRLVGRPWKRWIDSVNDCLKKRGLNVGQARRVVYERNEWREFYRGNAWGVA